MHPCPPPFAIAAAALTARSHVPSMRNGSADATTVLDYCRAMRIAAIGKLLLTGRPREFFVDLEKSGKALAHFVGRAAGKLPAGRALPFFDAIACGDTAAAATIANATPRRWEPEAEYEDDYLYLRFLMDLTAPVAAPTGDPLSRFAELAETPDPRLDCCLALQHADASALDRALQALVDGERTANEELAAEGRLDPDEAVTSALLSVEGLAIVQIATQRGLAVARELPQIPSLARRLDLRTPLAPDAWQEVEALGVVA